MPISTRIRTHDASRESSTPSFALIVTWGFLALAALAGGASRVDEIAQTVVRIGAIVTIAVLALGPVRGSTAGMKAMLCFFGAAVALAALQLVPMPSAWWVQLPGRDLFAVVRELQIGDPWRPISVVPDRGWNALLSMLPPLAMLTCWAFLSPRERTSLIIPIAGIGVFSAALGIAQLSQGPDSALRWYDVTSTENLVGLFANRNHQALLLAMTLPLLSVWGTIAPANGSQRLRFWAALGMTTFVALAIPVTGSRAGLLLGAIGLVIAAAVFAERGPNSEPQARSRWAVFGMIIALVGTAIVLGIVFGRDESVQRLLTIGSHDDSRRRAIGPVLIMIPRFFPVGSGFGSFEAVYQIFEPSAGLARDYMNQAHNDFLQIILEGGLAGAMILGAFVIWFATRLAGLLRATRRGDRLGLVAWAVVAMALAASAVDYPLRTPLLMTILVVLIGWVVQGCSVIPRARSDRHVGD